MERVAQRENRAPEFVRERVAERQAVIPANRHHESLDPMIIGQEFATKVNANIGNSDTTSDLEGELRKLHTAVHYGADTVMDLSTGSGLDAIRETNVEHSPVPVGTVPIYEAVKRAGSPEDITFSLGDGLRPGCLAVAGDEAQFAELDTLGRLTRTARDCGVQVMVERPGHVPMDEVAENVERQREVCDGAPFYLLGPLVTDVAPGYDHVTSAIGAAIAAEAGAAMLCYVTPKDISVSPTRRTSGTASRPTASRPTRATSPTACRARATGTTRSRRRATSSTGAASSTWRSTPSAREYHDQSLPGDNYKEARFCSMCGAEFCSMRIDQDAREAGDGTEDGEMSAIDDATDLDESAAADVNLPPTGTHDTSRVPEMPEFAVVERETEERTADD